MKKDSFIVVPFFKKMTTRYLWQGCYEIGDITQIIYRMHPNKQNSSDATIVTVSLENRAVSLTIQRMGILIAHIIFLIMYISITYQLYSNGKNQILSMRGSTVWSLYLTRLSLVSPLYCSRWSFIILMELISLSSICVWGRFTCNK